MATLREHLTASTILTLHLVGSAPLQRNITQERDIARRKRNMQHIPGDEKYCMFV